ncbi:hypothetical protein GALMADRAFT_272453 [Galerina marginata CBS 339.88]|uniref:F-box domain-containing protein n=1 Tax=Galerina marginata (strain CBS 339.88) TaxID=685588 RepID=A0A067SP30_GALM3|nr:hypothetical protein GALMADRAFT_272453 [Galerina marginata CBS 339.88]
MTTMSLPLNSDLSDSVQKMALQNSYILNEIFSYLKPDRSTEDLHEIKKQLGWAALTCRAFVEPAGDAQWSLLTSPRPLFRCFQQLALVGESYDIRGTISEQDLSTFSRLARKVKILVYCPHVEQQPLSGHAFLRVANLRQSSDPIFPSLREFHLTLSDWTNHELMHIASPSLTRVMIEGISEEYTTTVAAFMLGLHYRAKSLAFLGLKGTATKIPSYDISQLRSLVSLSIVGMVGAITTKSLKDLSTLCALESIELDVDNIQPRTLSSGPVWTCGSVSTLKHLTVRGKPQGIMAFMTGLSGVPLASLHVTINIDELRTGPQDFVNSLPWAAFNSLHHLHIEDLARILPRLRTRFSHFGKLPLDLGYFFCKFLNLQWLRYDCPGISLNESEFDSIISQLRWPRLETFSVPLLPIEGCPQLDQIRKFVLQHPHLRYLQIPVQFEPGNIPDPTMFSTMPSFGLETLLITSRNEMDDETVIRLAEYLDHLFPNLKNMNYSQEFEGQKWRQVFRSMQLCQRIREKAQRQIL